MIMPTIASSAAAIGGLVCGNVISKHIEKTYKTMEENNMKSTVNTKKDNKVIITEEPKKSTDKMFEIDTISAKISKLELDMLNLKKPSYDDWKNINCNKRRIKTPPTCDSVFIYDNDYLCFVDANGDVIGGNDNAVMAYCTIFNKAYPDVLNEVETDPLYNTSEPYLLITEYSNLEQFEPCVYSKIGIDRRYVTIAGNRVFIDDENRVLGSNNKSAIKRYNTAEKLLKDHDTNFHDTANRSIENVCSEPKYRMVYNIERYSDWKAIDDYNNTVKELKAKISELTTEKNKLIEEKLTLLENERKNE